MTKYEAAAAISSVNEDQSWVTYRDAILKILDQIDQTPAEFSVREMVELLQDGQYWVQIYSTGKWYLVHRRNHEGHGLDSLRDKLVELAKPEDPEVMVPMKLSLVKYCAKHDCEVAKACKAALEKAGVKT